jgi:oligoribonuclease
MDLEMTGLDPKRHVIVEIATLVTDDELNVLAEGPDRVIGASTEQLGQMDEYVTAMHRRSGLLSDISFSQVTLEQAGEETLAFIKEHAPQARTVPLCGNSIGTDRRFLAEYLPAIEEYLHYRSIDVSSIKELARRWYPGVLKHAPAKQMGHRAMDDIKESVAELSFYRSALFRDVPLLESDVTLAADPTTASGLDIEEPPRGETTS